MQSDGKEPLSLTGRRWVWPEAASGPCMGSAGWIEALLARRGIVGQAAIERYLSPSLSTLDDPVHLADIDAAVTRLSRAISSGEAVLVYGDYDVDGVCSTAVLVDFLRRVGARVEYYIPDRRSEGYGLNLEAVRQLAPRVGLIVTVDCGITAHEEVALAAALGVDVVVVDHHRVPEVLPAAVANVNPHRPDCAYPFKDLCAAGVTFLLVAALRRALRDGGGFAAGAEPDLRELLDLVALATVADMVPLRGTNRTLVAAGLRRMAETRRVGLLALLAVAGVSPSRVTAADVAFRLGPRVNAGGRMGHAGAGVELFLTADEGRARALAASLDEANRERRELEARTVEAATEQVLALELSGQAALVVYEPSWHPGVLGLVATRLVSRFHRPAIVIGEGGRGSGRTVEALDLHEAIAAVGGLLVRFGGHRAAAGVTIEHDNVAAFRDAFAAEVRRRLGQPPYVAPLCPEVEVEPRLLNLALLAQFERLEPFGQDNPEPLLVARNLAVRDKRVVGERHLKLRLGEAALDGIGFGLGRLAGELPASVDVAFRLTRNSFRGQETMQLRVEDLMAATGRAAATVGAAALPRGGVPVEHPAVLGCRSR